MNRMADKETLPTLYVGNTRMEVKEKAVYLGSMFNSKGNNNDMIQHRIQQARTCMINSVAMCNDITLGCYMFQSLMLAYKTIFIQTLLYGARAWSNVTGENMKKLSAIQLQFLKKILQVPRSTCNSVTYLELGVLPIIYEIHSRKLNFLHHILNRSGEDPVLLSYREQLKYTHAKNWGNESEELIRMYQLPTEESEIKKMTKEEWKATVKEAIRQKAVDELRRNRDRKSKAAGFEEEDRLITKGYLYYLNYEHARILFRIRCKNWDIKEWQDFKYPDQLCRLCRDGDTLETLDHVLRKCSVVKADAVPENVNVYKR